MRRSVALLVLGGVLAGVTGGCDEKPPADCEGVVCNDPPDPECLDPDTRLGYDATGVCEAGICVYPSHEVACPDGCQNGSCCLADWHDVGGCQCAPTACEGCQGQQDQEDGCGNTRSVDCALPATGCDGPCCNGACCAAGQVCHQGGCCTPTCGDAECGDNGCGGWCGQCDPGETCDGGACVSCGCAAGEVCVLGECAPPALLLGSPGASTPSLYCPAGYAAVGHWRTGPDVVDGQAEGIDRHKYRIDAGWMWLCSADPARIRVVAQSDDCGTQSTLCGGQVRGTWHVGHQCGGSDAGVDADGVGLEAGWLALCVDSAFATSVRVEAGFNDCGTDGPGCGAGVQAGSWHTDPTDCVGEDRGVGAGGEAIESGWMLLCVATSRHPPVDTTTMVGKVMAGYQGWFAAPGDGSQRNAWVHWFGSQTPTAAEATFDLWPDLSELDPDELFATSMTHPGGGTASLYSAYNAKTVARHFRWMADYGIDGAFLQRFLVETAPGSAGLEFRDQVTRNVIAGAEAWGRALVIMYDISGADGATLVARIIDDWKHLVDDLGVTDSPRYLHHGGLPLVAIWGFGFTDRPGTPTDAQAVLDFFRSDPQAKYHAAVMGGVPTHWRTGTDDSQTGFDAIYRGFDVISPWTVGRYGTDPEVESFQTSFIQPDLVEAAAHGRDYLPVVWPGFSWANLRNDPGLFNAIPRRAGRFFWKQITEALQSGCALLYLAMFDEVDESTAIFKAAATQAELPEQGLFLALDQDGEAVPTDWYLRLAGAGAKTLVGQIPWSADRPIE